METYNPYKMFVGSFIPNWLMCRTELSQGAKLCFARLAQYAGEDGVCFPSQQLLAAELGITCRQVKRYIVELKETNLIRVKKTGDRNSNCYQFLRHFWIEEAYFKEDICVPPKVTSTASSKGTYVSPQKGHICPPKRIKKRISVSVLKEKHIKRKEADQLFLEFYHAYPLKKKKTPSCEKFYKLVKEMTEEEAKGFSAMLMTSLLLQIKERETKEQHAIWIARWREPLTWLNQAGWEDEVNLKIEETKNEKSKSGWDYSADYERNLAKEREKAC